MRNILLAGSRSPWLARQARQYRFVRRAVSRFMPGEDLPAALGACAALPRGTGAVLTLLGENLATLADADVVTRHYLEVIDRSRAAGLDVEISIKPTQLGLDLSAEACERHLGVLAEHAAAAGGWVWVDMESTAYTDATLDLYRRVKERFPRLGVCLQAYLYRTAADLEALLPLGPGIRLVKGAYKEPADRAFPRKRDVDENFFALAQRLLGPDARRTGTRAIFATHDGALIRRLQASGRATGLAPSSIEFQMLYGIRQAEQARVVAEGHPFRVLISYGDAWFAWYMRRLAERPANVLFVVRSIFST